MPEDLTEDEKARRRAEADALANEKIDGVDDLPADVRDGDTSAGDDEPD